MSDEPREEERIATELAQATKSGRLQSAAIAAIAAIPWIGSSLAVILGEELSSRRWERLNDFLTKLSSRLTALKIEIDERLVRREEVIEIVEQAMLRSSSTESEVKHDAFAGLVAAALTIEPDWEEMRFFLSKVEIFSPLHLRVLLFIASPERELQRTGKDPDVVKGLAFPQVMQTAFEGIDLEVLKSVWHDLFAHGFVNTDVNIFGTLMASTGGDAVRGRLQKVGQRFVDLLLTGEQLT